MSDWLPALSLVAGDTLDWSERVPSGRKAPKYAGDRSVIARVEHDAGISVSLRVLASGGRDALAAGSTVRRLARTLLQARARRLRWDDEAARAALVAQRVQRAAAARSERLMLADALRMEIGPR